MKGLSIHNYRLKMNLWIYPIAAAELNTTKRSLLHSEGKKNIKKYEFLNGKNQLGSTICCRIHNKKE